MKSKVGSNKSFGLVFFVFFLIVSLYPLFNNEQIRIWSLIISLMFLLVSLIYAKILTPLNIIWSKLGTLLGTLISPIVMAAVFFIVVTPTAVIMRILGKNLLSLKKINKKTYWIERSSKKSMMKNQF